jgi:3-oxoacyl-[acyl-carrier-protein] synthase II
MTAGFDGRTGERAGGGRRSDVVVTGLGATTPLGGDVASTWAGLLDGRSGVTVLDEEWAAKLPVRIAGRLAVEPSAVLDRVEARRLDRGEQVALIAARQAWADAGFRHPRQDGSTGLTVSEGDTTGDPGAAQQGGRAGGETVDPERLAVVIGTGISGALTMLGQHDVLRDRGHRRVSPLTVPMLMPNGPAATVGLDLGARAAVRATVSACASGSDAIALGLEMIRSGAADVAVVGGAEACIHPLPLAAFGQMRALSMRNDEPQSASRPFDKQRDGFVLAEGAGVLVLERAEDAAARGARPYAVLAGAGITADGYHITAPDPEGTGAARAITAAVRDGGLSVTDVVHVNAHATATAVGDLAEAKAIRAALGEHPVVTAPKSMLGHLIGAAGAVETIATILSVRDDVIPATRNLDDPDEGIEVDLVRMTPRRLTVPAAVNDAFGFGGHNVALAVRKA